MGIFLTSEPSLYLKGRISNSYLMFYQRSKWLKTVFRLDEGLFALWLLESLHYIMDCHWVLWKLSMLIICNLTNEGYKNGKPCLNVLTLDTFLLDYRLILWSHSECWFCLSRSVIRCFLPFLHLCMLHGHIFILS